ncbi:FUSC family protein [Campylobacter corcagiensis]|uniref:FUSC family protein n=1 Tax=Campylobacter corcagiensis TaxID=1448857 RepID=A0A7M1LH26_9BACT|nr:FUSC family protein [Campylobacter corcagiensis]QKF65526.1 FUSC family protein [Campylobacter corcagiensis]QOQ87902.1 FUSC family protein [Campylobacter corcagiensis]
MINLIRQKDPANFGLIYAIKALFGVSLTCLITFTLAGKALMLWAISGCVSVFFITTFKGSNKDRILGLMLFVFLSFNLILLSNFINALGIWLFLPAFVWIFLAQILSLYSINLSIAMINSAFICFVVLVVSSGISNFNSKFAAFGFILGSVIALIIRGFSNYGKFTKRAFKVIFNELSFLAKGQISTAQILDKISKTKDILNVKSSQFRDDNLIQNHTKVAFYLYKCEELVHALALLNLDHTDEIVENINELRKLFLDEELIFKYEFKNSKNAIVYEILDDIKNGSNAPLLPKKAKFSLKSFINSLNLNNQTFKFSLKFALAIAISLIIANLAQIERGVWVAIGTLCVMKVSVTEVTKATFQAIISTTLAVVFAVFMINLLSGSFMIYPFIFVAIFMLFYFKIFSYPVSNFGLIVCVSIYFFAISGDFKSLMILRLMDMSFGFLIACFVSFFIFPVKNSQKFKPLVNEILENFVNISNSIIQNQKTGEFTTLNSKNTDKISQFRGLFKSPLNTKFDEISKALVNIRIYSLKNGINSELKKDILDLKIRFIMLISKLNSRPYYFKDEQDFSLNLTKHLANLQSQIYNDISPNSLN